MIMRPIIYSSLAIAALALTGCNSGGRTAEDMESRTNSRRSNLGLIVINQDKPRTKLIVEGAKAAASKMNCDLTVESADSKEELVAAVTKMAAARKDGVIVQLFDPTLGFDLTDQTDRSKMKLVALDVRPVKILDSGIAKYIDMPFVGMEDREAGNVMAAAQLDEAQKRGWKVEDVSALVVVYDTDPRDRERMIGVAEAFVPSGVNPRKVTVVNLKSIPSVDALQSAAANALGGKDTSGNWIVTGPSDAMVRSALQALVAKGVPESRIVGVGYNDVGQMNPTPVAGFEYSVLGDPGQMGAQAVELLHKWQTEGRDPGNWPLFIPFRPTASR